MKEEKKISDYFSNTMTDLLKACFSDVSEFKFKNTPITNFFFYMTKYKTEDKYSEHSYVLNPLDLHITLANTAHTSDTPEISILLNYLQSHILKIDDNTTRNQTYSAGKDKIFTLKPISALLDYCKEELQIDPSNLKNMTQDSIVDIITICFLAGRHGIPAESQYLHDLLDPNHKSAICKKLNETKTKFIVIYGDISDRLSHYMLKYILNQLYGISHHIDYESYQSKTSPENLYDWLKPKYENMHSQLYSAILNAFLLHEKKHYIIIHDIPSVADLHTLIADCNLCKNVILLCDFYIESPKNSNSVTYLPFKDLYMEPCENDIKHYFEINHITDKYGIGKTLLTVSKGNIFFLHALALLVKNLSKSSDSSKAKELKRILDSLSLEVDKTMIPTNKFSMCDMDGKERTSNNLIGHVRRLYKNILSIDEWLLILLIALHGEKGLSKNWLLKIFSEDILGKLTLLINKNLINENNGIYTYEDSLLIPYALAYGKQRPKTTEDSVSKPENNEDPFFSDVFYFLNFMLDEICYYNSSSINYNILAVTIKKTCTHTFSLLSKSNPNYQSHFAEIWYYHIRCIRFFLENGDIGSIIELNGSSQNQENKGIKKANKNLQYLAQKLTERPGKEYIYWKKLYNIYMVFLDVILKNVTNPFDSRNSYIAIIDKIIKQINLYSENFYSQSHYAKLLLSLIEILINLQLDICILGIKKCQICNTQNNLDCYIKNIFETNMLAKNIFSIPLPTIDKKFIDEITNKLHTAIIITDIYTCSHPDKLYTCQEFNVKISNAKPRYIQLSLFRIKCSILNQQIYFANYTPYNCSKSYILKLKTELTTAYNILKFLPINMLEDYYHAIITYTLFIDPHNIEKTLTYIYKDMERYEHIWNHSAIIAKIHTTLLKLQITTPQKL